jgi:hypothetical protein
MTLKNFVFTLVLAISSITLIAQDSGEDPYEHYVKNSKDFKPVKQDKAWAYKAWPSWVYMPWYYQWTIGHDEAAGNFSVQTGYNGAFIDHGHAPYLDWINQFKLRFYGDHTAGKGDLYVHDSNKVSAKTMGGARSPQINDALKSKLQDVMKKNIENMKTSPYRAAYALDDEISWGSFVKPCFWKITDDAAYKKWLEEIYGAGKAPDRSNWIGYDAIRSKLPGWTIGTFDASPLMDELTFNDSTWNNFLGDLVEYANTVDPETPCGFVGGQCPNAFGGYDYAKVMRKVQFLEAYNIGSTQSIVRSFNPHNCLPQVTTHFHQNVSDSVWQPWYYVAHGNRGVIGWVEKWFDKDKNPMPWHKQVSPSYLEIEQKISPLQAQSEWIHDGVAIYYNHASIQLCWILDAEAHGGTWKNRNGDDRLGSSHLCRHAWENMLRDEGLQYNFLSYADVIQNGIPKEYKVLILPGTYCLSDVEAERIKAFCKAGGTVIADYLPGCWDQHGKGREKGGALDDMFGVKHDPGLKASALFGGKLWVETDQDTNFSWKTYQELLTKGNTCVKDATGFNKAVRDMEVNKVSKFGQGKAVLMNLSPQWYNAYRAEGFETAKKREVFMKHVKDAGCKRWVEIEGAGDKEFGYEVTYWNKDGRTILFVCSNPEIKGNSEGGGNSAGLKTDTAEVTLKFAKPVSEAKDERAGTDLGKGDSFKFQWKMNEDIVMSFK